MPEAYDFSGMATAYGLRCQDGRVIKPGAFDWQNGEKVPLVWRHGHKDINNVVGHGVLSVSEEPPGMRIQGRFNKTTEGNRVKKMVVNRDVDTLSIYANELLEHQVGLEPSFRNVEKGTIREVSLVLAGQNPGAYIEEVVVHGDFDEMVLDGVIVHSAFALDTEEPEQEVEEPAEETIQHGPEDTLEDITQTLNEDQRALFNVLLHSATTGTKPQGGGGDGSTLKEVYSSLTEEQRTVLQYMLGEVQAESTLSQGDEDMPQHSNIFDTDDEQENENVISHEQVTSILERAIDRKSGSLKEEFLAHSITDLDYMFPDARNAKSGGPDFISRDMEWVGGVLSGCSTRPFSKVKSLHADITADEARALGYTKGDLKVEEVITLLKRETGPQTIYKKQKLDRDDVLDITEFNVVMWMKGEMKVMLREELARAIMISDGRLVSDDYKIEETKIRPIYNDSAVYTTQYRYHDAGSEQALAAFTAGDVVDFIDYIATFPVDYKGAGSPVFYCTSEVLNKMLLVRDADNHRLHRTQAELASALRVSRIVEVPVMSNMTSTVAIGPNDFTEEQIGVIVNLRDYVIGANNGAKTAFFDDFDIDYNQMKYLYETRVSGALVTPKAAVNVTLITADLGAS